MTAPQLLQLVSASPDGSDIADIRARHASHLSSDEIIAALERSAGVMTDAARLLHVHRDTLYERMKEDAAVRAALPSIREQNLDLAEGQLLQAIREGDGPSIRFYLRTIGRSRGYSERLVVEQPPEPPRQDEGVRQAALDVLLKRLTPDEVDQFQAALRVREQAAGRLVCEPGPHVGEPGEDDLGES